VILIGLVVRIPFIGWVRAKEIEQVMDVDVRRGQLAITSFRVFTMFVGARRHPALKQNRKDE
jgi:hypothetical protein